MKIKYSKKLSNKKNKINNLINYLKRLIENYLLILEFFIWMIFPFIKA